MGQVRKIKAGLVKISVNDFVGEDGHVFFDIDDGIMRLSDGATPGGIPLSSGGAEGGASTFRQLLDTPSTFIGAASNFVKVNAQGSALEFVDVDFFDGNYANLTNTPTLFSGSYADLTNKPTLVTSYTALTDLPTLFSGSYTDLTNKPTLFNPAAITQDLIPDTNVTVDLGSTAKRWRDLYLSGTTIDLAGATISNVNGTINLPANTKINGSTIPLDISDLTDTNNVLSASGAGYSLPIASNSALGGIKIGTGLSIADGVVSVTSVGVTSYNDLTDLPSIPTVPTNISAFTNDLGYLTSVGIISYNDLSNLPSLFSGSYANLTNLPSLFDGAYSSLSGTPDLSVYLLAANAFSGSYTNLTNTPTIPADISDLTDTGGLLAAVSFDGSYNSLTDVPNLSVYLLAANAFSGSYADLANKPTTLAGYGITDTYTSIEINTAISTAVTNLVDSAPAVLDTLNELAAAIGDDANFVTTINQSIALKANIADLHAVATSGNYSDLVDLPIIPADVGELSDTLKSIIPNAEAEIFAMAVMLG